MANCYAIQNPTNGQTCKDDVLGDLVYNKTDGTWEKKSGYTQDSSGAWMYNLNQLPGNKTDTANFFDKYRFIIIGVAVFVVAILLMSIKKK